ncbi:ABC transporter substrate-binding protein [Roseateles sp.]|uniref:ABC transporter substrate-binding protein n=1 Tax=Roseateles sp. TaxID=1971397 RepID=UPI0039E8E2FD
MRLLLATLSAMLLLVACDSRRAGNDGGATAANKPVAGGELVFAFDGAGASTFPLDPQRALFAPHVRIMRSVFDSLVAPLPGNRFGPWLATEWQATPDGRSTTFKLRQDVTFHDGTRFDAAAVKANFDRIADPNNTLPGRQDLTGFLGATVVDEFTVRLDFSQPFAPLLSHLAKATFGMISPTALARYGDQIPAHPVGTGPFKVTQIVPGSEVVTERFEAYRWAPEGSSHTGAAWLQRLVFKNVPEEATRAAVLANGQAQAVDLLPPQNLVQLRGQRDTGVVEAELLNHNYSLHLNITREPWTDPRVRLAFRQAIDLDAIVKTIYLGTAQRAWAPLSPGVVASADAALKDRWKPDRTAAAAALDAAGWKPGPDGVRQKDGKRLVVQFLDSQGNREKRLDVIAMVRRQLREAGFDLRIDSQPGGSMLEKARRGEFDLVGWSQFASDPDVLRRIYSAKARTISGLSQVDDAELNDWLDAAVQQTDPAARAALYAKAQERIIDATYSIPIYVLTYNVVHSNKVRGITIGTYGFPQFHGAWVAQP